MFAALFARSDRPRTRRPVRFAPSVDQLSVRIMPADILGLPIDCPSGTTLIDLTEPQELPFLVETAPMPVAPLAS
jgi:hypothetical protein